MMTPSASARMRFDERPISSAMRLFFVSTPSSSRAVSSRTAMRSFSGWVTRSILAPTRCLRSSMQNIGGVSGFS